MELLAILSRMALELKVVPRPSAECVWTRS